MDILRLEQALPSRCKTAATRRARHNRQGTVCKETSRQAFRQARQNHSHQQAGSKHKVRHNIQRQPAHKVQFQYRCQRRVPHTDTRLHRQARGKTHGTTHVIRQQGQHLRLRPRPLLLAPDAPLPLLGAQHRPAHHTGAPYGRKGQHHQGAPVRVPHFTGRRSVEEETRGQLPPATKRNALRFPRRMGVCPGCHLPLQREIGLLWRQ